MQIKGKQWGHLVKTLETKAGPAGLYPEPRVWAEGKDWEGYQGNFSFGFFKQPCVCHPVEGAVMHPYDEALVFAGLDLDDMRSFDGGEVSIEIGEEREEHVFTEPTVVCLPKGTPHGPVKIRKVGRPIVHYLFGLDPVYSAETIPDAARPATTSKGNKYADLVHPLRTNVSIEFIANMANVEDPGLAAAASGPPGSARGCGPGGGREDGRSHPEVGHGPREWRLHRLAVR